MSKSPLLTTLFLLLICSFGIAQSYHQIPSYGARWKIEEYQADAGFPNPCYLTENYYLYTDGDTTIAGIPVTKVRATNSVVCNQSQLFCYSPQVARLYAYLHQDSTGRLFRVESSGAMFPLMDFSLSAGDTMSSLAQNFMLINYVVDSIDSVTYSDGILRKRLYVHSNELLSANGVGIWVEGIGDIYHGPSPRGEFENYYFSHCYKKDSVILVPGWTQDAACPLDCDLLLGISANDPSVPNFVTAFPNPSKGSYQLEFAGEMDFSNSAIKVYDISGKLILESWLDSDQKTIIQLPESAETGIYFAKIELPNGQHQMLKLLKH